MPLAHIGHLLVDLPLFAGPVVTLAGALWWTVRRERAQERAESSARPSP